MLDWGSGFEGDGNGDILFYLAEIAGADHCDEFVEHASVF